MTTPATASGTGILQEFTAKYKDALIISGVVIAAITSSGNLALSADKPAEANNTAIRTSLTSIETRLSSIEYDVASLSAWQDGKDDQLRGRGEFMSCAVQQIQENRRASSAEKACQLSVPR